MSVRQWLPRRWHFAASGILFTGISIMAICLGDIEQDQTAADNQNRPASAASSETAGDSGETVGSPSDSGTKKVPQRSEPEFSWLQELSDDQLIAIAGGAPLPTELKIRDVTSVRAREALLHEIALRWATTQATRKPAEPAKHSPELLRGPAAAQAVAEPDPVDVNAEGGIDDAAVVEDVATQQPAQITAKAFSGSPLAVGMVELAFADDTGPSLPPDHSLQLTSRDDRIRYATFEVAYPEEKDPSQWQVDSVRVRFLIRGDGPLEVNITDAGSLLVENHPITILDDAKEHRDLAEEWWAAFTEVPEILDDQQKGFKQSIAEILGRRLDLPGPWPNAIRRSDSTVTDLEKQFEHAVAMLFGIESVKLAMQESVTLHTSGKQELADRPLPRAPTLASVRIPAFAEPQWVESISAHVPEECFYVRTGNLTNYRYFRQFLLGWGGSLDDIVATRALDRQTRDKVEFQLGLRPDSIAPESFDAMISDMALIGCDPLFDEGSAIGLIFRATDGFGLAKELKGQRRQVKTAVPEATEQRVEVFGDAVSFLSTADNRLRSFYAIDGEYHLITNSASVLKRFYEAGRGDRSLRQLEEFRYARSKTGPRSDAFAYLYLSDPFFKQLVSPRYRIEMTRRRQAARELREFRLARLVAHVEGNKSRTVEELKENRFLPSDFAIRPDGSVPTIRNGQYQDSLRGSPGAFLPIPDVTLGKVTASEERFYHGFANEYRRQWRRVDPVTVVFERKASGEKLDDVSLDIFITPYAPEKYAALTRFLGPASEQRLTMTRGNLINIDAGIRLYPGRPSHSLNLGLRDAAIPFEVSNGEVRLSGDLSRTSFAKSRLYAAMTPPNDGLLRELASVLLDTNLGGKNTSATVARRSSTSAPALPILPSPVPQIGRALMLLGWAANRVTPGMARDAIFASLVETRDDVTVASRDREIRDDIFEDLVEEKLSTPCQVRLQMRSLSGSKVEPYIQTQTYLNARHVSSANARFVNDCGHWLGLPPERARSVMEDVLGAKICCPLGGQFVLQDQAGHPRWASDAWTDESPYSVSRVPESWKFPFLDWLHRLDLRFDLDQSTASLSVHVDLTIRKPEDLRGDGGKVALQR